MRKTIIVLCLLVLVICLSSCRTLEFDRTSLQANDYSLVRRLPSLEIMGAETTQLGASDQVSTASYIYTVFKRELAKNVLESSDGQTHGSIEMVLIYENLDLDIWWGRNAVSLEFEIHIYDVNHKKIWTNTYSGETIITSSFASSSTIKTVGIVELEHKLLDEFKDDIKADYNTIVSALKTQ